jgi:hypothetical protein
LEEIVSEMLTATTSNVRAASSIMTKAPRWKRKSAKAISDEARQFDDLKSYLAQQENNRCCVSSPAAAWMTASRRSSAASCSIPS